MALSEHGYPSTIDKSLTVMLTSCIEQDLEDYPGEMKFKCKCFSVFLL